MGGTEKDIDEVLQTTRIFKNVSKGQVAKQADIKAAFGDSDEDAICRLILAKGDLQIGQKERDHELRAKTREAASIVSSKCINTQTNLPFPIPQIEKAMKEIKFIVKPSKNAKQLAIELIKLLEKGSLIPLARQQMRLRLTLPPNGKKHRSQLAPLFAEIENEVFTSSYVLVVKVDPGNFRNIDNEVKRLTAGKGTVEVLEMEIE